MCRQTRQKNIKSLSSKGLSHCTVNMSPKMFLVATCEQVVNRRERKQPLKNPRHSRGTTKNHARGRDCNGRS